VKVDVSPKLAWIETDETTVKFRSFSMLSGFVVIVVKVNNKPMEKLLRE